jgi:hypothetical protein
MGAYYELTLGLFAPRVIQQAPKVGVNVEQADHVRSPGNSDHRSSHDVGLPALVAFQTSAAKHTFPAHSVFWLV